MWAQLIKMRLQPGKDLAGLDKQMRAIEQPDSGLLRSIVMRDQKDPGQFYVLVVFESEEKARARERDPRRQEGLQALSGDDGRNARGPAKVRRSGCCGRVDRVGEAGHCAHVSAPGGVYCGAQSITI
jgi:hypothetical protein